MPTSPYPAEIVVARGPTVIGGVGVTLYDVSVNFPDNVDVLLVSPDGRTYVLMGDAGGSTPIRSSSAVTLTFSDSASQLLPNSLKFETELIFRRHWNHR